MTMRLSLLPRSDAKWPPDLEAVEHKGVGHPDSLADGLANHLSATYASWTLGEFGEVLHHNFDKLGLLGGRSSVRFGGGELVSPIRVVLCGRASWRVGQQEVPVYDILEPAARAWLVARLRNLDPTKDLRFIREVGGGASPGAVSQDGQPGERYYWFEPRSLEDVRSAQSPRSNDTAAGCAFWPLTPLEAAIGECSEMLAELASEEPWLGTDVKIMATRVRERLGVTVCIPQVSTEVTDVDQYSENLAMVRGRVVSRLAAVEGVDELDVRINTADDLAKPELYLTLTGSALESGDEGLVGRGNRSHGMISMTRPFSIEGVAGKNPLYHVGKLYNMAAQEIAKGVHKHFGVVVDVLVVSEKARGLDSPAEVVISSSDALDEGVCRSIVGDVLNSFPDYSRIFIADGGH